MPASAHALKKGLEDSGVGEQLHYQETVAGHSFKERANNAALTDILDHLPLMRKMPIRKGHAGHADRPKGPPNRE